MQTDLSQPKPTTGTEKSKTPTPEAFYPGNKYNCYAFQKIINNIPPHDGFVSGFLGQCAVLTEKRPASFNIGIDTNLPRVLPYWNKLQRSNIELHQLSFFDWADKFTWNKNTPQRLFIYLDPPYLLGLRGSKLLYGDHELTDQQHARLIALVQHITAMSGHYIAISHYPCPEYDQLLKQGWRKLEYVITTQGGVKTEALYMNYPPPDQLHEYTHLGGNRTRRQMFKRKVNSILGKLDNLPALERNAILAAVTTHYINPVNQKSKQ